MLPQINYHKLITRETNGPVSLTWVHRICWIRTSLEIHDYKLYNCISFHPCRSIRQQIWPYHKKWPMSTQGHHLNKSGSTWVPDAIYTKFQVISLFWDFWRFLPYVGLEAILVTWPGIFEQIFIPVSHGVCVYSGLTSLSTIFQSHHDGVWLRQGAQCSLLFCCLTEVSCPRHLTWYHTQSHYPDTGSTSPSSTP